MQFLVGLITPGLILVFPLEAHFMLPARVTLVISHGFSHLSARELIPKDSFSCSDSCVILLITLILFLLTSGSL